MGVKHESKLLTETVCDDGDDDKNDARAHTSANNVRQASEEEEEAEVCSSAQVLWSESARVHDGTTDTYFAVKLVQAIGGLMPGLFFVTIGIKVDSD
jgi:hypothetical protein